MPVPAALLDMAVEPSVHVVDERWTMASAHLAGQPDAQWHHDRSVRGTQRAGCRRGGNGLIVLSDVRQ